jgi:hypothetical protein
MKARAATDHTARSLLTAMMMPTWSNNPPGGSALGDLACDLIYK